MGLHLTAVTYDLNLLILILEVAFALGMVIFVHELGHFAVAKWCGVKVEKFYLGFDIYGLKLARFKSGETEYGIGILPLGGYVKMLGQDDNPSRAAGERERSILRTPDGQPTPLTSSDTLDADGERYQLDPRSYMAKSVPQRMAIISAGVIMNVIFAFVAAMIAYSMGVSNVACGISSVAPGEAAWRANLRPGDQIVAINDSGDRPLRFGDLMTAVAFADMSRGVDFRIKREGVAEPFWVNVRPDMYPQRLKPTIGVAPPATTTLRDPNPVIEGTPAAAIAELRPNDRIVAIDRQEISGFADYKARLVQHADKPLRVTIERGKDATAPATKSTERLDVEVPARPVRTLGLAMKIGKITAIQSDSPAEKAGLRADDLIVAVDGQPPGDPLRLPDELRRRAPATITLKVARETRPGQVETIEKEVTLREPRWSEELSEPGSPVGVPALGVAYKVFNVIQEVRPGSPAAGAELTKDGKPAAVGRLGTGDELVQVDITLPEKSKQEKEQQDKSNAAKISGVPKSIKFSADELNWPFFNAQAQMLPEGTKFMLTLKDGRTTTIEAADAADWFNPNRGFVLSFEVSTAKAHSVAEAAALSAHETVDAVTQVYAFLRKIGSQLSPKLLGGPVTIAEAAGGAASKGLPELLIFLTMLSANLAVINFLPIPLLDGGHMVFLTLEGIMRRPVSERVVVAFHYLGFLFIISLMFFVLGLDVTRLIQ